MPSVYDEDDRKSRRHSSARQSVTLEKTRLELRVLRELLVERQETLDMALETVDILRSCNAVQREELRMLSGRGAACGHRAYYDELTGMPNCGLLLDRLGQAISRATRQDDTRLAVLFLDLNGLRNVNDRFGPRTGDMLLRQVALRLRVSLRAMDTACRYRGDEFVLMLPNIKRPAAVAHIADRLRACLTEPYLLEGKVVGVNATIGTATYPAEGREPRALIYQADLARHARKKAVQGARV